MTSSTRSSNQNLKEPQGQFQKSYGDSYSDIMQKRWISANAKILHKLDYENSNSNNQTLNSDSTSQYKQQCYLMMRYEEEAYALKNYVY